MYSSPKCFTSGHAISGFKKTGLFPLNIANIDKKKLEIAQTFNKNLLNDEGTSNESQISQSFAQIQTDKAILSFFLVQLSDSAFQFAKHNLP